MAKTPRSTTKTAFSPKAALHFSTPPVIGSVAANTTVKLTGAVTRQFKPDQFTEALWSGPLEAGLVVGQIAVVGNAPDSYTYSITIGNLTAAPVVSAVTLLALIQE